MELPYSPSADRNKEAIGDALANYLSQASTVFEIGSGTGQHAIYLCGRFKNLQWQPTEQALHLESLAYAIEKAPVNNIAAPVELDVAESVKDKVSGGTSHYTFAYSSNTAHIMSIDEVAAMFQVIASRLDPNAFFALYGPFKIDGSHTSDGNAEFDANLRMQQSHMGIRDKDELEFLANSCGLELHSDNPMPANNRILLWRAKG